MDVVVGYYRIQVDGKELPDNVINLIDEVTYQDNDTGADTVTIDVEDINFYFLSNPKLFEDLPIMVEIGYNNVPVADFSGFITLVEPTFPATGVPSVSIFCMDETHKLNKDKKTRTWNNMKVSDILNALARDYGLKAEIEETERVYEKLSQSNETDMQFAVRLVEGENNNSLEQSKAGNIPFRDYDYVLKVKNGVMRFYTRNLKADIAKYLWYNSGDCSIQSFSPKFITNTFTRKLNNDGSSGREGSANDNSKPGIDPKTGKPIGIEGFEELVAYKFDEIEKKFKEFTSQIPAVLDRKERTPIPPPMPEKYRDGH